MQLKEHETLSVSHFAARIQYVNFNFLNQCKMYVGIVLVFGFSRLAWCNVNKLRNFLESRGILQFRNWNNEKKLKMIIKKHRNIYLTKIPLWNAVIF